MALFRQALAFAPFHAAAHANLGSELMKSGQWDEARKHLETAVRLDPSLAAPEADLGIVTAAEGDYQEALPRFEESLRFMRFSVAAYEVSGLRGCPREGC